MKTGRRKPKDGNRKTGDGRREGRNGGETGGWTDGEDDGMMIGGRGEKYGEEY